MATTAPAAQRVRSRLEKVASLALHGARALRARRQLDQLAERSPVARALVALARDQFTAEERRVLATIERERARLFARQDEIEWRIEDPLDPATAPAAMRQVVGPGARLSSVKPHWGRLLYTLVREVRPKVCVELGACFGMSGMYIQAAQRHAGAGTFVTFEGSSARAEIARGMYRQLGFEGSTVVVGDFDRTLAPKIAELGRVDLAFIDGNHRLEPTVRYDALIRGSSTEGGVIVHDDIRWSAEMVEAWRQVVAKPGARAAFDVFRIGIIELGTAADTAPPPIVPAWLGLSHLR